MFLYPEARQFPFDEVCELIVRALEERNWNVPGITVDFDVRGTGDEKYRRVSHIKGGDFKLWFGRAQGRLGRNWSNAAAVTELIIPKKELHVYEDESGPLYYEYVGQDWEADKEKFLKESKFNSRLKKEPRWYLKYKGGGYDGYDYRGQRPPFLLHDSDLLREYATKGGEARSYRTTEVLAEFTQWFEGLLALIVAHPVPPEKVDIFREEVITYADTIGPIFCFGGTTDAERVRKGKLSVESLEPSKRYALMDGRRLLSLGTHNDGTVPDIAYEGYKWCGLGEVTPTTAIETLEVPGHYRSSHREQYVFRIRPNRANDMYVVDNVPDEMHQSDFPERTGLGSWVERLSLVRARTIIPITEYTGGYNEPVVLIGRELDFDEVELVSGPWPEI